MGLILKYSFFTFTLISFCIFVSSTCFRRNPKQLFYDKSVSKGSSNESAGNPFLERVDNPKGTLAYKNFSIMSTEKNFVTTGAHAGVTPAQQSHTDFYLTFFRNLPNCYTQEEAFVKANIQHFNQYGKFRYLTFKSFINGRA